ncbi:MAG: HAMP domain-containing protein, partial [Oscillochloris sp.]|nr:HAMP domain-containing protein [Oscillochloris sp.]
MGALLSFRTKIVLLMLVTTLLVMIVGGLGIDRMTQRTLLDQNERYAQQVAASTAAEIGDRFSQVAAFPQTLSALAETAGTLPDRRLAWYNVTIPALFKAAPPEILSLTTFFVPDFIAGRQYAKVWYVRDHTGQVVPVTINIPGEIGYDKSQPLYDYFKQEWYTAPLKAQGLVWSEPYYDAGGANVNMVTASIPAFSHGTLAGVATADVEIDTINTFINTIKPTEHSYALLISRAGTFIANPRQPELVLSSTISTTAERLQSSDLADLGSRMLSATSGFRHLRDPFSNLDSIAAYHPIGQTGWSMVIIIPEADLLRPLNQLRLALLEIGFLAMSALALLGWLGTSRLLRPFTVLYEGVQRFSNDHSALQLGIKHDNELGHLAAAFEQMSARIASSYTHLEHEVSARTADLRQSLAERDRQASELAEALAEVRQKEQEVLDLSVPIVPLLDDTLVVPIIGVLSTERAISFLQTLLAAVEARQARVVIMDITGLALIDERIADLLLQAASAVRLLGAELIMVG